MKNKNLYIFGGGTIAHITSHLAVCAPSYGNTAYDLCQPCRDKFKDCNVDLETTKLAESGISEMETNEDVANRVAELVKDPNTKVIFFSCALIDWAPRSAIIHDSSDYPDTKVYTALGKYSFRLESRGTLELNLDPANKIINTIRKDRKDIFLVGFKTTCGATKQTMFEKGLRLCKESSANLVLVNDVKTRWNMIVTPEEVTYHETSDRKEVIENLVEMAWYRSQLTFTQSTVVDGKPVPWSDPRVPASLRTVVDYCVAKNAYKPFKDATVGHFAVKLSDTEFLTSIRKSNFNNLKDTGLVYVKTDGPDTVLAYGAKPSVGGQSQRIVFKDHPGYDCIVHFHCPLRMSGPDYIGDDPIPIRAQREVECGSHQCGKNTSDGLKQFGNLKAVYLDQHGPNIVFNRNIDPKEVIDFIERNFDLSKKTGGYQL